MLLQISYKDGVEEYLDIDACKTCSRDKWIQYAIDGEAVELCGADWDEIKAIYINQRPVYARPYDRGLGAEA